MSKKGSWAKVGNARRALGKIDPAELIASMRDKEASTVLHHLERTYRCLRDLQALSATARQ
jgi:hypothetical protein